MGAPTVRTRYKFLPDGQPAQLSVSWEAMAITGGTPTLLPETGPSTGTAGRWRPPTSWFPMPAGK